MISPTDQSLVRLYVPTGRRPAWDALFSIHSALGDILRSTSEPTVGRIRLAWWRERLDELESGVTPGEPRLAAAARFLIPEGISGSDLAGLEIGWAHLLEDFPWPPIAAEATWFRGMRLFGFGARLLAETDERIQAAGGLWALVDVARHCSDSESRAMLIDQARRFAEGMRGERFAPALRPLSMLAALALRDLDRWPTTEPQGTPGRAFTLLRHRIGGRL